MKKNIIPAVIAVLIVAAAIVMAWYDGTARPLAPMTVATKIPAPMVPDFTVTSLRGRTVNMQDLRGQVVIINFWATWCPPCVIEMPILMDLVEKYQGRVTLLALSSDRDPAKVEMFLDNLVKKHQLDPDGPHVIMAMDTGRAVTRDVFRVQTYPESWIIDPHGQMIRHIVGITPWQDGSAEATIQELLAK